MADPVIGPTDAVEWAPRWVQRLRDHPSGLVWHPDGRRLAAGSLGGDAIVVDAVTGELVDSIDQRAGVLSLAWARDRLVTGGEDGTVTVGAERYRVQGWVHALDVSPVDDSIAVAHGRRVSFLDEGGTRGGGVKLLLERPSTVPCLAWHPEGDRLLIGSSNLVEWIHAGTGGVEQVPIVWGGAVASLHRCRGSVDRQRGNGEVSDWWVAGVRGDWSYAWRSDAPETVHVLPVPRATGELVAVEQGRARCVIASRQMTALFDLAVPDEVGQPSGQWLFSLGAPTSVVWHPDRSVLLGGVIVPARDGSAGARPAGGGSAGEGSSGGGGSGILRWHPDIDPVPLGLTVTPAAPTHLVWSPDGTSLAVALADGTVAVLDGELIAPDPGPPMTPAHDPGP